MPTTHRPTTHTLTPSKQALIPNTPEITGVDMVRACWIHDGAAADLVRALKYGRATTAVTAIADAMSKVAPNADTISMVTWVPCTPQRRRQRGFDPAELLARALARRLRRPALGTLRRVDDRPQTSRSRQGRLVGPSLELRGRHRRVDGHVSDQRQHVPRLLRRGTRRRINGRVLVIDDVCTTGSTLRVAATVLRSGGADAVVAVVATSAPAPSASRPAVAAPSLSASRPAISVPAPSSRPAVDMSVPASSASRPVIAETGNC